VSITRPFTGVTLGPDPRAFHSRQLALVKTARVKPEGDELRWEKYK